MLSGVSHTHRWPGTAARRSLCPTPEWSLSDWLHPPLKEKHIPNINKTPPLRTPRQRGAFDVWWRTFNAGDIHIELGELLTGPLDALVDRLDDLLGVLLHPPGLKAGKDEERNVS